MSNLISMGIFCCFSCCCKQISQCMHRLLGPSKVTKAFYFILIMIFTIPTIIIFFFLNKWKSFLEYFSTWISCPESSGSTFQCIGSSVVYRLSFSLLILFTILMLFMFCRNKCSQVINEGLFCIKYIIVCSLFIGLLFVDNNLFYEYEQISKYISIGYMLLQSIILIDIFYIIGIKLINYYNNGQQYYAIIIILLTSIGYAIAITLNIFGYVGSQYICNSLWVNIINTFIIIIITVVQLFNCNPQNSLLTTSLVASYISYLAFIAQFSYLGPDNSCNKMSLQALIGDVITSTFFFVIAMYGSITGGTEEGKRRMREMEEEANAEIVGYQQKQPLDQLRKTKLQRNIEDAQESYSEINWIKWHFYMCLAAVYIGMLITNWAATSIVTGQLQGNDFGFWVRIIFSWLTALLYIWTLIAPRIFPDRSFIVY